MRATQRIARRVTAHRAATHRCASRDLVLERGRSGTAGSFHEYLDMALVNNISPPQLHTYRLAPGAAQLCSVTVRAGYGWLWAIGMWRGRTSWSSRMRAYFTLHYIGSGPCSQHTTAYGVRITPPGSRGRLVIGQQLGLCSPASASLDPIRARQFRLPPSTASDRR
jgi:hypothetical protein